MKYVRTKNSQAGFSLVELMVVVAIIGILASLAIPSVGKYMAKARQSEAKTQLASLYTAEKAFFAEYTAYHSMFGAVGYSPEGNIRYTVGFDTASAANDAGPGNGYGNTPTAAPGTSTHTYAYCGGATPGTVTNGCALLKGADNSAPQNVPGGSSGVSSSTAFVAAAAGIIYKGSGTSVVDRWTINEAKTILNPSNGIP